MADLNKTIDGLERLRFFNQRAGRELWGDKPHDVQEQDIASADMVYADAIELLKSQQAEIERLEKENGTLKLAIQSMPNWLNEKRPEVIRCKDCKHSIPSSECFVICTAPYSQMAHTTYKPIDWYCPEGERKDGDDDGN